jgi:hypothetical protein
MLEISTTNQIIGSTYSSIVPNIYEQYESDRDAEIFENVVLDYLLTKHSDDQELIEYIMSLPKNEKRMATLLAIDGDNILWSKMNSFVNGCANKLEHIKDVIKIINQFVKDGEVERKKYGEVMTPITLVREMLDTLPKEVWSNPNLKWLDPANGAGTYPFVVIYKLMLGLTQIEDIDLRYKHIVENMIYTCELQSRNVALWLCGVDPKDELTTNTYWGSFLDEGFDYHMKNVWSVNKFDIIIGNPPYQELSTSDLKSSDQGRVKLWMKFVEKSLTLCDLLLFITPNNWLSATCHLNEVFKSRLLLAQVDSNYLRDEYFKSVGSTFSFYLLSNKKSKSDSVYFLSGKNKMENNILSFDLFPTKDITIESISIFEKVQKKLNTNIEFIRERYQLLDNIDFCISIDRSKNKGFVKPGDEIFSTSSYWYKCSSKEEQEILLNNLNTKLYKFLIKNIRSGMAIVSTINKLPIVNFKKMTDVELYQFFNLTDNEIKFIDK